MMMMIMNANIILLRVISDNFNTLVLILCLNLFYIVLLVVYIVFRWPQPS